jgi:hypothetical protein
MPGGIDLSTSVEQMTDSGAQREPQGKAPTGCTGSTGCPSAPTATVTHHRLPPHPVHPAILSSSFPADRMHGIDRMSFSPHRHRHPPHPVHPAILSSSSPADRMHRIYRMSFSPPPPPSPIAVSHPILSIRPKTIHRPDRSPQAVTPSSNIFRKIWHSTRHRAGECCAQRSTAA